MAQSPKIRHVVFIGETGSGKSSVINLFADRECARTSPDAVLCTRQFAPHDVSVEGKTYRLWDTPGLNEASDFKRFGRSKGVTALKEFLQKRHRSGELDLLVFCIRGNRARQGMTKVYKMFGSTTRSQTAIPVVVAVTHLEKNQPAMEAWWHDNARELERHHRRWDSQQEIRFLISREYRRQTPSVVSTREYLKGVDKTSCVIC